MPYYYKNMDIAEDTDSDITWTMQEAVSETVDYNFNGRQPREPVGYRYMTEENKIKKKKKKLRKDREKDVRRRPKSAEVGRTKKVEANKDLGYGLGLSRGFSLWRTLKDMRHCITKVSNPLTKAQRRSLRRKLSYYVDDLERIVVGVNPRAPVTEAEESVSGDEEMREEVNALIEDALDEAALQGKIVQSGYFETRMSYLEQKCATLKKRLEELADQKSEHHEAASMILLEHQDRRKTIGPKKRKVEVQVEEGEFQEREQLNKREVADQKSVHQEAASKTLLEHQGKRKVIGPKKRKVKFQDEEGECQDRQQLNKQEVADQKSAHQEAASKILLEHLGKRKTIGPKKGKVEVQEEEGECQEREQLNIQEVADQKSAHHEAASKTLLEHQGKRKTIGPKKGKFEVQEEEGECQEREQLNKQEVADQKSAHQEAASKTLLEHQGKRKTIGPKKGKVEVQEEEGECQEREQLNKQEVADQKSAHQEAASKTLLEHQAKRKAIGPKKRKVEVQDEEGECQDRQQMNKQGVPKKSSTLCSSAAMSRRLNDGSVESHREEDGGNEVFVEGEELTAHGKERNQKQMEKELTQALRQEEETSENEEDVAGKIQADVPVRQGNKSFKGWDSESGPSSKGGRKGKQIPNILKRISLEY